jgi:DNA-binding NtrC family response regulator
MPATLLAWIGNTDLKAKTEDASVGLGPIAQAIKARVFDRVILLGNCDPDDAKQFTSWLQNQTEARVTYTAAKLQSPMDFGDIFEAAVAACEKATSEFSGTSDLTFHLSPGTPAMAAVWILLAKTRFPAQLIESSRAHGVKTANVPFELSLDFIPDLLRDRDAILRARSAVEPPTSPEFADIKHRSRIMKRLLEKARRVAFHNVPVLIEGESGTGKEMLARAIHRTSPRRDGPFVAVNCGAIPHELIESELFGHEKGAFTGAAQARKGYFESANGGSLFLDEIGELPLQAQVRMLRVLQEGEVVRVGSTTPIPVDARILAATNRTLSAEIASGTFREDLFFRLAVAVLNLPPLRDRQGDVGLLIDELFDSVSLESATITGQERKVLSAGAKNVLINHRWPGNVRELANTIRRLVIWADGTTITAEETRDALLPSAHTEQESSLNRPLGEGLSLPAILEETARHYLARAMEEAGGNKTKAAALIGLPSYQTLTNWLERYEIKR